MLAYQCIYLNTIQNVTLAKSEVIGILREIGMKIFPQKLLYLFMYQSVKLSPYSFSSKSFTGLSVKW